MSCAATPPEASGVRAVVQRVAAARVTVDGRLVGAIGVGVLGYGFYQLYRAWKIRLDEQLELNRMRPAMRRMVIGLSRFGLFAREDAALARHCRMLRQGSLQFNGQRL